jgi:hypothetical protein
MSTLYRIFIILVVALIVGGLMYAAVGSGSPAGQSRPEFDGQRRPEGGEEREGGVGLPFGIVKSLGIMSVASGVYLAVGRLSAR